MYELLVIKVKIAPSEGCGHAYRGFLLDYENKAQFITLEVLEVYLFLLFPSTCIHIRYASCIKLG